MIYIMQRMFELHHTEKKGETQEVISRYNLLTKKEAPLLFSKNRAFAISDLRKGQFIITPVPMGSCVTRDTHADPYAKRVS
jgi:hypothetical protein